jgi:hypothetical protein
MATSPRPCGSCSRSARCPEEARLAIKSGDILGGRSALEAKQIADAAPGSPFASDLRAGYGGVIVPTGLFGGMVAYTVDSR